MRVRHRWVLVGGLATAGCAAFGTVTAAPSGDAGTDVGVDAGVTTGDGGTDGPLADGPMPTEGGSPTIPSCPSPAMSGTLSFPADASWTPKFDNGITGAVDGGTLTVSVMGVANNASSGEYRQTVQFAPIKCVHAVFTMKVTSWPKVMPFDPQGVFRVSGTTNSGTIGYAGLKLVGSSIPTLSLESQPGGLVAVTTALSDTIRVAFTYDASTTPPSVVAAAGETSGELYPTIAPLTGAADVLFEFGVTQTDSSGNGLTIELGSLTWQLE